MTREVEPADVDWKADFESVRLQQMLQIRTLSLRQKLQAMEDMAELARAAAAARERAKGKAGK